MVKTIIKFIGAVVIYFTTLSLLGYFKSDVYMYFISGLVACYISEGFDSIVDNITITTGKK
jgi:hypothetical protein